VSIQLPVSLIDDNFQPLEINLPTLREHLRESRPQRRLFIGSDVVRAEVEIFGLVG
jgi:hypothetical protein